MNKTKEYKALVEEVKEQYRLNPFSNEKIKLGWCDLKVNEDLCHEINLWTYWQGFGYAEKTPRIKVLLLGQDFGPPQKEEEKGTICNVRSLNSGNTDVMFQTGVNLDCRNAATDKALVSLFHFLGYERIDQKRYSDLFFCNFCLGYRDDNYSGNMTRHIMMRDAGYIKRLVDILEPDNIICLGLDTSVATMKTFVDEKFTCKSMGHLIESNQMLQYKSSRIFPMAHPGYWGMKNRGEEKMREDWKKMKYAMDVHIKGVEI